MEDSEIFIIYKKISYVYDVLFVDIDSWGEGNKDINLLLTFGNPQLESAFIIYYLPQRIKKYHFPSLSSFVTFPTRNRTVC